MTKVCQCHAAALGGTVPHTSCRLQTVDCLVPACGPQEIHPGTEHHQSRGTYQYPAAGLFRNSLHTYDHLLQQVSHVHGICQRKTHHCKPAHWANCMIHIHVADHSPT